MVIGQQRADHHREEDDRDGADDDGQCPPGMAGEEHLRPLVQVELAHGVEAREGAHHENIAMGEIDELHDAVDHRVAEGDQGVHHPEFQPVEDVLEENRWGSSTRLLMRMYAAATASRRRNPLPTHARGGRRALRVDTRSRLQ